MGLMFKSCALVRTSLGSYSSVDIKKKETAHISTAAISKTHAKQVSWLNSSTGERKKYVKICISIENQHSVNPVTLLQLSTFNQTRNKTMKCLTSSHQMKK